MNAARLLLHPVMIHRRSRALLFWYTLSAALVGTLIWWRLDELASAAGLSLSKVADGAPPIGRFLYQPYVRAIVILLSSALATGITAIAIVGPIRRIEEWLAAWEVGLTIKALKVRNGDQYETMIRLFNELHLRSSRLHPEIKRSRTPTHKPIRPIRRPK